MLVENVDYTTCLAGFQNAKGEFMAGGGEVYTWSTFGHFLSPGGGNISKRGEVGNQPTHRGQGNGVGAD